MAVWGCSSENKLWKRGRGRGVSHRFAAHTAISDPYLSGLSGDGKVETGIV